MKTIKLYEISEIFRKNGKIYSDRYGYIDRDSIRITCSVQFYDRRNNRETTRVVTEPLNSISKETENGGSAHIEIKDLLDDNGKFRVRTINLEGYTCNREIISWTLEVNGQKIAASDEPKQALLEETVYVLPDDYKEIPLLNYEIQKGDYVVSKKEKSDHVKKQTFLVKEVYHQPNKNNLLCKLYSEYHRNEYDVDCNCEIWRLPYKEYPERENELAQFDSEIRERELNPFWENGCYATKESRGCGNLYWQNIEDAALYIVSLYKYYPKEDVEKKLYLLEEFEVDRNKHWLTIHNLFGSDYIIRMKAEDRSGKIVAESRGIKIRWNAGEREQKPEFWIFENKEK